MDFLSAQSLRTIDAVSKLIRRGPYRAELWVDESRRNETPEYVIYASDGTLIARKCDSESLVHFWTVLTPEVVQQMLSEIAAYRRKMRRENEPDVCPVCGRNDSLRKSRFRGVDGINRSAIECRTCGVHGPVVDDDVYLVSAWNEFSWRSKFYEREEMLDEKAN